MKKIFFILIVSCFSANLLSMARITTRALTRAGQHAVKVNAVPRATVPSTQRRWRWVRDHRYQLLAQNAQQSMAQLKQHMAIRDAHREMFEEEFEAMLQGEIKECGTQARRNLERLSRENVRIARERK